jgi:CBS domain-containing protein
MNPRVSHFMNTKLVYLREGERPELALRPVLDLGITAVPVLDEGHRPVGVVSIRDIVGHAEKGRPEVSAPALTISTDASLASAARQLAERNVHHLIVVDGLGRAVGMLSSLDVIRGLIGLAPKHPQAIESFEGTPKTTTSRDLP